MATTSSMSAAQQAEIARKAAAGIQLTNKTNAAANALYEQYKAAAAKSTGVTTPTVGKTTATSVAPKTGVAAGVVNAVQSAPDPTHLGSGVSFNNPATKHSSTPAPAANPNKVVTGNISYTTDTNGYIYKNGQFVDASNYKYLPPAIVQQAAANKAANNGSSNTGGSTGTGTGTGIVPGTNITTAQKAYFDKTYKGGWEGYVANQQNRYATAGPAEKAALEADAKKLGYQLGTSFNSEGADLTVPDPGDKNYGRTEEAIDTTKNAMDENGQTQDHADARNDMNNYADYSDPSSHVWDDAKAETDHLGTQQYLEQKAAYENLIKNLSASQKADLDAIMGNLQSDQNNLSDDTFQQWMAARQGLAGRGLTGIGAGFQNDANTRLQMNQQNALGKLFTAAQQNIGKTQADYREQLQNAYTQQAGNLETDAQRKQFWDMYNNVTKNTTEMAKMYQQYASSQLPYSQISSSDLLHNSQFYDQLDQQDKQFYDQLAQNYDIAVMQYMGTDPKTGKQTLDAARLNEDIRHNKAMEKNDANRITADIIQNAVKNGIDISGQQIQAGQLQAMIDQHTADQANIKHDNWSADQEKTYKFYQDTFKYYDDQVQALAKAGKSADGTLLQNWINAFNQWQSAGKQFQGNPGGSASVPTGGAQPGYSQSGNSSQGTPYP